MPPHEDEREYHIKLSEEDDLFVKQNTRSRPGQKAQLIKFAVEYTTFVEGRKKRVIRYDNNHGLPHVHHFDWKVQSGNSYILGSHEDASDIFNEALRSIKTDWSNLKKKIIDSKQKYE